MINIGALRKAHTSYLELHYQAVASEAHDAGEHAQNHVMQAPRFRPRTGRLQAATSYRIQRRGDTVAVIVENDREYAAAIDTGARPHVILPRRAKYLRFQVRGKWVFAKRVNHPGNRPYKFLYRANQSAYRIFGQGLASKIEILSRRF